MTAAIDLEQLARDTVAMAPKLGDGDARLAVSLYRLLAHGRPVDVAEVARQTATADVETVVRGWPGVHWDDHDRIVGFWGLALGVTAHAVVVGDRRLYAWCAFDTLFLPRVLGESAVATSTDARTGAPIRLRVGPDGEVESTGSPSPWLSFVRPGGGSGFTGDVVSTFCHHILFFASDETAGRWAEGQSDILLLTLDEGVDLAGRWVDALFGGALATGPTFQDTGS